MGFTLRAALAELGDAARVTVAELIPAVVAWARGPMAAIFDGCLDDPRVTVREADVGALIASSNASYDAILLDVDNGPDGLTVKGNDRLYSCAGLARAHAALQARRRAGGLVVRSGRRLHPPAAPGGFYGRGSRMCAPMANAALGM